MKLKLLIGVLLLIQAVLFAHMVWLLSTPGVISYVPAEGGNVSQITIAPSQNLWGGIHGELTSTGNTSIVVSGGDVNAYNVYYNDTDNNCSRTELFASTVPINPATIAEVSPIIADQMLGFDNSLSLSVTSNFIEYLPFELGGTTVYLFATRTRGQLRDYLQGVGISGGNLVFVTSTVRNSFAYDGTPAEYQFMLPAGTWVIDYDDSDTCSLLDETLSIPEEEAEKRLTIAVPSRVCLNEENIFYGVQIISRRFCAIPDVSKWFCQPVEVDATFSLKGSTTLSTSAEDGRLVYTPTSIGTHSLRISTTNETAQTGFRVRECIDRTVPIGRGTGEDGSQIIDLEGNTVNPFQFPDSPRRESPEEIIRKARIEFTIISFITILVIILGSLTYYQQHKDDRVLLLQIRIWFKERFKKRT